MTRAIIFILGLFIATTPAFADAEKEREEIRKMSQEVLARLYEEQPETRQLLKSSVGYAVFSNVGVNVIFFSAGGGSGIVHDNRSGKETFMNMGSAGIGLGLGVKDFRAVFMFHSENALDSFIESGWDFSTQADAAAKASDKGAEGSTAASAIQGVSVYQLTETGLALQATLQGTKYWKDDELNTYE